ncbi:ABC transporter substrate-binding protein [Egicoccus sp. AB-alg6-2]|uniref:ABC transporter substrate-binding protein n=1 Tax=Egicoccus sp. AB-alg6-2 TaxID=3242692 RepID=UPI00359F05CC
MKWSRRSAGRVVPALALALLLSACSSSPPDADSAADEGQDVGSDAEEDVEEPEDAAEDDDAQEDAAGTDGWSFTDDRGVTVTLDEAPTSIAAYAEAGGALIRYGITPVGMFGASPIESDPLFEGYDITSVESFGATYGEVEIEKMIAADVDLIVSTIFADPASDLSQAVVRGFNDLEQQAQFEDVAPIVGINAATDARTALERMADLAEALGADLESEEFTTDRAEFDEASEELEAAAAEESLTVMAISVFGEQIYVAQPSDYADLSYYQELGVDVLEPDTDDAFWEALSYEQADKYHADVIIYDDRPFASPIDELLAVPTFGGLPAVEAEQLGPWRGPATPLHFGAYAENLRMHAELFSAAQPLS